MTQHSADFKNVSRRDMLKTTLAVVGGAMSMQLSSAVAAQDAAGSAQPKSVLPVRPQMESTTSSHFPSFTELCAWDKQGRWPASWIQCPGAEQTPIVVAFRLPFTMKEETIVRIHVSADERYQLFLDGESVGRGSERGNLENWFYESYDLTLKPGAHHLVARVWSWGSIAPLAQFHVRTEFLLAAGGEHNRLLSTGSGKWECKVLDGYSFKTPVYVWGLAAPMTIDGRQFPWGFERGETNGWVAAKVGQRASSALMDYGISPSRYMRQGTLPPMVNKPWATGAIRLVAEVDPLETMRIPVSTAAHLKGEANGWDLLLKNQALTIPARTTRRVLIDLENYLCAYTELISTGGSGSVVQIQWTEGLRIQPDLWKFGKGNRDEIEGKYFIGMGNTFLPDGGRERRFETLWWGSGRYVEVVVKTAEEPLTINRLAFRETHYPLEMESKFSCSNPDMTGLVPLLTRGMQMCAHETFVDCPYFEQMQYVADARVESLCSYMMTRDERLPRKAMFLIDRSRHASGLTEARYPVREPQFIPWFSLIWIGMVHDYALWRDDSSFVCSLMPGMRNVIETFLAHLNTNGQLVTPEGWNDTDVTKKTDQSAFTHWLLVRALEQMAELEQHFGEPELATRCSRKTTDLAVVADKLFWNNAAGFYAETPGKDDFAELVQAMAILSGHVPKARLNRLRTGLQGQTLKHGSPHGTHYLFEAFRQLQLPDLFYSRLQFWYDLKRNGLKTPIEDHEPNRSDCHAWSSHPLIHYYTLVLGIRPSTFGFRTVDIAPQLGSLSQASGTLVHPSGAEIAVDFKQDNGKVHGRISLPPGITGKLHLPSGDKELTPGIVEF